MNTKQLNFATVTNPLRWSETQKAVDNVNNIIASYHWPPRRDQQAIDRAMIAHLLVLLTKVNLGANVILGVSIAVVKAVADYL